jgi:hypothetical protein
MATRSSYPISWTTSATVSPQTRSATQDRRRWTMGITTSTVPWRAQEQLRLESITYTPGPSRHSSAVEQLFRKQQVLGSNPSVGSTPPFRAQESIGLALARSLRAFSAARRPANWRRPGYPDDFVEASCTNPGARALGLAFGGHVKDLLSADSWSPWLDDYPVGTFAERRSRRRRDTATVEIAASTMTIAP